jgi:hypothetical protein
MNEVKLDLWLGSWDWDYPIKNNYKKIMKWNSLSSKYWWIKLKKKSIKKNIKKIK